MGAFESFLNTMAHIVGGGEDPKEKPSKKVFTSQEQITQANNQLRDLLFRQGAPQYLVNNSVVARNVGDKIPEYTYPNGRPNNVNSGQTELPKGVSVNDVFQEKNGTYGYIHPQQGNWVQVDPQAIYAKYKK